MLLVQPICRLLPEFDALAAAERLGYELLEPFMPPYLNDEEARAALAGKFIPGGFARSVHGAFIDVNPASGDAEFRALSKQRILESCDAAGTYGLRHVVLHGSCFPFLRGGFLTAWADACAEFYFRILERYPGLTLCIENSFDLDPAPLRELMRRCSSERVRVCLDLGHVHYSLAPVGQWFDELGEYIGYLHLSDNCGSFDEHLPLGQGTVDWVENDRLARYLGDVPVTLEVGDTDGIRESLRFLSEKGIFGR